MKKDMSFDEINDFAKKIGEIIKKDELIALIGDLGTGKTNFTKILAKAIGIEEPITSPTFTLLKEYNYKNINFIHFDVYRLSSPEEIYDLGYEDYIHNGYIVVIEWADIVESELPKEYIEIKFSYLNDFMRTIEFEYKNNKKREMEILNYVDIGN